jgi:hypothetical protein
MMHGNMNVKFFFHFADIYGPGGTLWRNWLRHCTTSRKVAGSIPMGSLGFFNEFIFLATIIGGPTQPLKEIITRDISWGPKAAGA